AAILRGSRKIVDGWRISPTFLECIGQAAAGIEIAEERFGDCGITVLPWVPGLHQPAYSVDPFIHCHVATAVHHDEYIGVEMPYAVQEFRLVRRKFIASVGAFML